MTKQHKATPEQWARQEELAAGSAMLTCLLELRARVEALEATQQPRAFTGEEVARIVAPRSPAGSLVERVVGIIGLDPVGDGKARAAIREVAAALIDWWDSDEVARTGWEAAKWLEQETKR